MHESCCTYHEQHDGALDAVKPTTRAPVYLDTAKRGVGLRVVYLEYILVVSTTVHPNG